MLVKRRKFDPQHMKTTSERITQPEKTSDDESGNICSDSFRQ